MADGPASPWLSVEQAAEYLGMTPRWIYAAVRERRVRAQRFGKFLRFRTEWLDALGEPAHTEADDADGMRGGRRVAAKAPR